MNQVWVLRKIGLLVDVVGTPVPRRLVVPFALQCARTVLDETFIETGNEVDAANDVVGVKEAKCALVETRKEPNLVEALRFPSSLMSPVDLEPADPEDIHFGCVGHRMVEYLDPIDSQHTSIDVWMKGIPRERNDVWAAFHVDLVLSSTEIVRGIVHGHRIPLLEAIARDEDLAAVIVGEGARFFFVLEVKDASEEMVFEVWDEVLSWPLSVVPKGTGLKNLPSEPGHPCARHGPTGRGRHGRAPSPTSSSVDLVTWLRLLVLIAVGPLVSLHPSASSQPQCTCGSGAGFVPALRFGGETESCSSACRSASPSGVRARPKSSVSGSSRSGRTTDVLCGEAVGWSKSLDLVGVVGERMDFVSREVEWSQF